MLSRNQHPELWKAQIWKSVDTERVRHGPEGSVSGRVGTSQEEMELSPQDGRISQIPEKEDESWPEKS